ncbi:MAG: PIN domain nuclease [Deltaproteobacteria bacterium]|nr:MAG: PIN domain nuclease [Deltaproteobacteria bacterium]
MKILIDTHIFLWMLSDPKKLNQKRRYELESPANEVYLSSMSIAELMIKTSLGKLDITFDPLEMASKMRVEILNFTGVDAMVLGGMPYFHKDPFDRMIIAQAATNQLSLMSDDAKFLKYDCKVI